MISLLQEHIWEAVISYFKNYEIVIFETLIEKSKLYPFFVVLKKKEAAVEEQKQEEEKKVLLRMLDKSVHSITLSESKQRIKNIQLQNHFIT